MKLPFKKRKDIKRTLKELTIHELADSNNPWYDISTFAMKAKVTTQTVYNWIRSGKLEGGTFKGAIFARVK